MISIVKASEADAPLLAEIGQQSFIESHGHSATADVISEYVGEKFSLEVMQEELSNSQHIYHIVYHKEQPAGYSKIIFNAPHPNISLPQVTKLERLYLLEAFYHLKLGAELLQFNIDLSKASQEKGMWLFVWTENKRAVRFYTKMGFNPIGNYDFKLTDAHANPNYQMLLEY
jgi:ribosomal protein S18 acetylase RimI-like enzyme